MIPYGRLQAGLRSALLNIDNTLTVVWSPSEYPRPTGTTLVALNMISGPDLAGFKMERGHSNLPRVVRVTCTATEDEHAIISANGCWWTLDVDTGETVEEYRDRWIALLETDGYGLDATITPVSTNAFDIAGTDITSLYGFEASGECSASVTTSTFSTYTTIDATMLVEVQVFSPTRYLRGGAMDTASRLMSGLELQSTRDIMHRRGVRVINQSPITDITSLSGPGWESRAVLTLNVGARAFNAEASQTIETVDTTLVGNNYGVASITQTFSTSE
jgi:hypothetical protein